MSDIYHSGSLGGSVAYPPLRLASLFTVVARVPAPVVAVRGMNLGTLGGFHDSIPAML